MTELAFQIVILLRFRHIFISVIYNIVFRLIHVQHGVQLAQAGGFGGKLFLEGEGLV